MFHKVKDEETPKKKEEEDKDKEEESEPMMDIGDDNVCLVCYDHTPDAVFMECGHGGNNHLHISYYFRYVL